MSGGVEGFQAFKDSGVSGLNLLDQRLDALEERVESLVEGTKQTRHKAYAVDNAREALIARGCEKIERVSRALESRIVGVIEAAFLGGREPKEEKNEVKE